MTEHEDAPAFMSAVYSLTPLDYSLLSAAGFRGQGVYSDILWSRDNKNVLWQVDVDQEYLQFYQHSDDMKPESPRTMSRQEFQQRFNV